MASSINTNQTKSFPVALASPQEWTARPFGENETKDQGTADLQTQLSHAALFGHSLSVPQPMQHQDKSYTDLDEELKKTIQAKLTIGQPNDRYEQEAEQIAEKVMRIPRGELEEDDDTLQAKLDIQSRGSAPTIPENFERQLGQHREKGRPLSDETRAYMEPSFRADFSNVQAHETSPRTNNTQAQASTHGQNIYFNSEKFNLDSSRGKEVLAHELTQVVQRSQKTNSQSTIQNSNNYLQTEESIILRQGKEKIEEHSADKARSILQAVAGILSNPSIEQVKASIAENQQITTKHKNACWDFFKAAKGQERIQDKWVDAFGERRSFWINAGISRVSSLIRTLRKNSPKDRIFIKQKVLKPIQSLKDLAKAERRTTKEKSQWGELSQVNVNGISLEIYGASEVELVIIKDTLSILPSQHLSQIPRIVVRDIAGRRIKKGGASVERKDPRGRRIEITRYALKNKISKINNLQLSRTLLHETGHMVHRGLKILPGKRTKELQVLENWFQSLNYGGKTQGPEERVAEAYWRYFFDKQDQKQRLPSGIRRIIESSPAFQRLETQGPVLGETLK